MEEDFLVEEIDEPTFTSALQESSFSKSFAFSAQLQDSEPTFSTSLDDDDEVDNERIALQESSFTKSFAFSAQFQESSPTFSTSIDDYDDYEVEEDDSAVFTADSEDNSDAPALSAALDFDEEDDEDASIFASSIPELEGFGSFSTDDDIGNGGNNEEGGDDEGFAYEAMSTAPSFTASLEGSAAPSLASSNGIGAEGALSGVDEEARARVEEVHTISPLLAYRELFTASFCLRSL